MQITHANDTSKNTGKLTKFALLALIDNLEYTIKKLDKKFSKTEWGDYYNNTNYSYTAFNIKKNILNQFINKVKPKKVWDLGGNTGVFSRISSNKGIETISFDIDPVAVEKNYLEVIRKNEKNILPLVLDLTNPSNGIGWDNKERLSLQERGPVDMVMALALIHHLAISNNVPLIKIADFLSNICNFLIVEFIPKEDSKVKKLLSTREDIFPGYNQKNFENVFSERFDILESKKIKESCRTLYLMRKK